MSPANGEKRTKALTTRLGEQLYKRCLALLESQRQLEEWARVEIKKELAKKRPRWKMIEGLRSLLK